MKPDSNEFVGHLEGSRKAARGVFYNINQAISASENFSTVYLIMYDLGQVICPRSTLISSCIRLII